MQVYEVRKATMVKAVLETQAHEHLQSVHTLQPLETMLLEMQVVLVKIQMLLEMQVLVKIPMFLKMEMLLLMFLEMEIPLLMLLEMEMLL
jgi:hypothetical protein